MTSERIKEIQEQTAYPESASVMFALEQVWNECAQEQSAKNRKIEKENAELESIISELRQIYFFNIDSDTLKVKIKISTAMELWERVYDILKKRGKE